MVGSEKMAHVLINTYTVMNIFRSVLNKITYVLEISGGSENIWYGSGKNDTRSENKSFCLKENR